MEGKIQHNGTPLDFSFLKLQDVQALAKERPREGRRKPIQKDDEDEEKAKETQNLALEENQDEKKDEKTLETVISRAGHMPQIADILTKNFTSLKDTKNLLGGRKQEDGKEEQKRQKEINYEVNSLFLNNN